jgi:hypothetical protein
MSTKQQEQQLPRVPKAESLDELQKALESQPKSGVNGIVATTKTACVNLKDKTTTLVKQPEFQKVVISTAGGTVAFGAVGGAFGTASGVILGSAVGLPPALLTFGLSIPVCAGVGGAGGLAVGTVVGAGAGGVAGFTTYKYRLEIKEGIVVVKVKATDAASATKLKAFALRDQAVDAVVAARMKASLMIHDTSASVRQTAEHALVTVKAKTGSAVVSAKAKASDTVKFATTTRTGVTSTTALTGGVVGGTAGGGAGMLAGAAAGVVPALFTFGLSIPVGAALGLCCGTAVGGSAGVVTGGALGYGGFTYKKELLGVKSKMAKSASQLKLQMTQSATYLVGGGTGGSESQSESAEQ